MVGRHDEVAREHDLEAPGQAEPLTAAMIGLGNWRVPETGEAAGRSRDLRPLAVGKRLEIHAGAERLVARSGDDDHPAVGVFAQFVHDRRHGAAYRAVDGVAGLGSVDGEDLDVPSTFPQDFIGHGCSLRWWGPAKISAPLHSPAGPSGLTHGRGGREADSGGCPTATVSVGRPRPFGRRLER